jgi:hypothetical protein
MTIVLRRPRPIGIKLYTILGVLGLSLAWCFYLSQLDNIDGGPFNPVMFMYGFGVLWAVFVLLRFLNQMLRLGREGKRVVNVPIKHICIIVALNLLQLAVASSPLLSYVGLGREGYHASSGQEQFLGAVINASLAGAFLLFCYFTGAFVVASIRRAT